MLETATTLKLDQIIVTTELLVNQEVPLVVCSMCFDLCVLIVCRTFPWVLAVYDMEPYDFYKVIELVIRAEDGFWRDVIKHLNSVCITRVLLSSNSLYPA